MKRLIYFASLVLCMSLVSCEKDEPGETNAVSLAGQWMVTVDAVDENGEVVYTDDELFGVGEFLLLTYSASANNNTIFIDDLESFWDFKVKVDCNLANQTFEIADASKYVYASFLDPANNSVLGTFNNYKFTCGNFDSEAWAKYEAGEISISEYFDYAVDYRPAGYSATYNNKTVEVGMTYDEDYNEDGVEDDDEFYDDVLNACNVIVSNGSIVKGGATTPSGVAADYIEFTVSFDDDPYPDVYGYTNYKIHGYRYTGLAGDE